VSAGPFFYGIQMRFRTNYSSVIRISATDDALYLSVVLLFRIGHPPLCIPLNEVTIRETKSLLMRFVVLTLGAQEQIPMRIPERMARNLGILERVAG
jgi:hypothetical protein